MTDYPIDFQNGYKIQTIFSNKTADGIYGDIYDFQSEVEREHPGAEIMTGYCVIDAGIGLVPDGCNDWNDTISEAIADYEEHVVPYLEQNPDGITKHSALTYAIANAFETALLEGETSKWDELCAACYVPGDSGYGIVVWGAENNRGDKGFSVSLRHNFDEETWGSGNEVVCFYAPLDDAYEALMDTCDKTLAFLEHSLKEHREPIFVPGPYDSYTQKEMQPLLDALNAGDFNLASELTPPNKVLCGFEEFKEDHVHEQAGFGWAGQFETTVIPAGRYPVFAEKYESPGYNLFSNKLKDFQGIFIYLAGKCIADSIDRKPEAYPFDNTVWESPYCHATAKAILENKSSIHLLPQFKAEKVHFEYNGEQHTTYNIVDTSLPKLMKHDPISLRGKGQYIRSTAGLSAEAHKLYATFSREFTQPFFSFGGSIPIHRLINDKNFDPATLEELLSYKKIQRVPGSEEAYALTAKEKLSLFHSGKVSYSNSDYRLKWKAEYEKCVTECNKKQPLDHKIQSAANRTSINPTKHKEQEAVR